MQARTTWATLILPLILLAPGIALAQDIGGLPILDSHSLARDFAGQRVETSVSVQTAGSFTVGRRSYLQIDIDAGLSPGGGPMPRTALINGFVSVALPPGLELDGQPRLQYYDENRADYEFMYSRAYPRLARFEGLEAAMNDAASSDRQRILSGLAEITAVLDPTVSVSGPADRRLTGGDPSYAVTGTSWLIPCNVMFHELVGLYDPDAGLGTTTRLRVNVPLKLTVELARPHVVVYVGGLSAAVDLLNLPPDQIPPTAIPLVPLPEQLASSATAEDQAAEGEQRPDAEEPPATRPAPEQPAPQPERPTAEEEETEEAPPPNPRRGDSRWRRIGSDGQDEEPDIIGDPPEEEEAAAESADGEQTPPAPPATPIPALVYSYEWLAWETEIALGPQQPLPAQPEPAPAAEPELPRPEIVPPADESAVPLVVPETLPESPVFETVPEPEVEPIVEPEPAEPPQPEPDPLASYAQPPAQDPGVRQVEPGTLPQPEQFYTVPLKPITGAAGDSGIERPLRDSGPTEQPVDFGAPPSLPPTGVTTAGAYVPPADLGEMVLIPEGYFLMGTGGSASAGDADELPQGQVYLNAYYIDKYPVTNRQFYAFVLSAGYKAEGNWDKYFSSGSADLPVRGVSWNDAQAYADWAGKRLPSEAEWEKAARGEDGRTYPWGEDWSSEILPRGEDLYDIMHAEQCASPYGVMGTVGLIWQWTASAHHPYPFNPDARGEDKVMRGGAYSNGRNIVRCANRYAEPANVSLSTSGFRCAKDAP